MNNDGKVEGEMSSGSSHSFLYEVQVRARTKAFTMGHGQIVTEKWRRLDLAAMQATVPWQGIPTESVGQFEVMLRYHGAVALAAWCRELHLDIETRLHQVEVKRTWKLVSKGHTATQDAITPLFETDLLLADRDHEGHKAKMEGEKA